MGNPLVLIVSNKENRVSQFSSWLSLYDVSYASTAEEAITIYSNNYLKIRVVLLDMDLPDGSGIDVLKKMKRISNLSEVIIVSDQYDIRRAVECIKKGAFDYLIYPFSQNKFNQAIAEAIDNIDYLSYGSLDHYESQSIEGDGISFMNHLVNTKELYKRSITRDNMYDLLAENTSSLSTMEDQVSKTIDDHYASFNLPKVLIVEDEDLYRNLIKAFLHELFDVVIASNGREAREILESEPNIDVVILDLFLPDVSGVDLIPCIQQKQPDSEIVIVTAYEQLSEATKLIRLGADNFLNKPILKNQLIDVIFSSMKRKYHEKIMPSVKKRLIEYTLSDEDKYTLLQGLIQTRKTEEKPVLMKDLYQYFPELTYLCLPDTLSISSIDLQQGIAGFVDELRCGLVHSEAVVSVDG